MAPIDDIAAIIKQAIIDALKDREAELTAIAEAGGKEAGTGIFGDVGSIVGIFTDVVAAVPFLGELISLPLEPLKVVEDAAGKSGVSFGFGYLLGNMGFAAIEPVQELLNHEVANVVQSGIFDAPSPFQRFEAGGGYSLRLNNA